MEKTEILKFINENPVFFLATADGDQPRARGMMIVKADSKGIIFNTGANKDLCRQLKANNNVELCFFGHKENKQIRITGKAHEINDLHIKQQVVQKFSFLKPLVEKMGYEALATFQVKNCVATLWSFETNLLPKKFIELDFPGN